jgi:hypothetical protein
MVVNLSPSKQHFIYTIRKGAGFGWPDFIFCGLTIAIIIALLAAWAIL